MYKFNQIEKLIKNNISLIKQTEIIKIKNASGRYLAESIYSKIDIPPNNNAAVDGYLFNYKNLISDPFKKYQVVSEIHAGDENIKTYTSKNAVKISTGAYFPKNFDTLIMEEDFNVNKKKLGLG